MTSYNKARKISFVVYIVLSALFAWLLIYLGKKDIERAASFAANEKNYIENLMKSLSAIDDALDSLERVNISSASGVEMLYSKFVIFRKSINSLMVNSRGENVALQIEKIKQESAKIASAIDSMKQNILGNTADEIDSSIILNDDFSATSASFAESAKIIHELLSGEYEKSGFWQRQSLFFFKRLQYLLITFFILTTIFIVLSSSYSGILLKKYLKKLSEGTKEISSGNLRYRFTGIEPDEMGSLMADFNSMACRLEQQNLELKKINKELEEKARQLIEANLHKDRFFANMSHELRTPLNSIIGFSDLNIERKDYSKEQLVENSRKILSAAEHLLSLISGLLDVAKADAGILSPIKYPNDICEILSSAVDMLRPLAEKKNLQISIEKIEKIIFPFDEKMMRQIFINIIGNAIKFTHEGGVKIRINKDGNLLFIEVEDSGIGISEKDQHRIFNDFHRVESGLTSNYEGVGLGLALSRRLVRLHGGEIFLRSFLGKGSVFTIKLPIQ